jgi:hypothetical protein
MAVILAYDIGTTGVKTCIYTIDNTLKLIGSASEGYELYTFPDGGAEQHGGKGDKDGQGHVKNTGTGGIFFFS